MELVAVLVALYVIECCVWVGQGQVVLSGHSKGRFRYRVGPHVPSGRAGGVFLSSPWPPLSMTLVFRTPPEARFDVTAIEARWLLFTSKTRLLWYACHAAWAYVLIVTPAVILWRGIASTWPFLVAGWIAILAVIVPEFASAFHACYPGGDRVSRIAAVVLSPLSATRACDLLARELLASYHPLAPAFVLCPREAFGRVARWCYFCADDPAIGARQDVEEFLGAVGRREDVLRPPDREDTAFLSYCPRCQAQYTRSDGHCADCGGVQVQPFV